MHSAINVYTEGLILFLNQYKLTVEHCPIMVINICYVKYGQNF